MRLRIAVCDRVAGVECSKIRLELIGILLHERNELAQITLYLRMIGRRIIQDIKPGLCEMRFRSELQKLRVRTIDIRILTRFIIINSLICRIYIALV